MVNWVAQKSILSTIQPPSLLPRSTQSQQHISRFLLRKCIIACEIGPSVWPFNSSASQRASLYASIRILFLVESFLWLVNPSRPLSYLVMHVARLHYEYAFVLSRASTIYFYLGASEVFRNPSSASTLNQVEEAFFIPTSADSSHFQSLTQFYTYSVFYSIFTHSEFTFLNSMTVLP